MYTPHIENRPQGRAAVLRHGDVIQLTRRAAPELRIYYMLYYMKYMLYDISSMLLL